MEYLTVAEKLEKAAEILENSDVADQVSPAIVILRFYSAENHVKQVLEDSGAILNYTKRRGHIKFDHAIIRDIMKYAGFTIRERTALENFENLRNQVAYWSKHVNGELIEDAKRLFNKIMEGVKRVKGG